MIYIFLSFLTGITIVINMVLNGKLAQREGMINGVIINYLMAVISSVILCLVMLKSVPACSAVRNIPMLYFTGGIIGVITTCIFNLVVSKISAVYIVILRFAGQMLASAVIDYIYLDIFSKGKIIGGLLFLTGLILNAWVDNKHTQRTQKLVENV